jgi:hypothetical protein
MLSIPEPKIFDSELLVRIRIQHGVFDSINSSSRARVAGVKGVVDTDFDHPISRFFEEDFSEKDSDLVSLVADREDDLAGVINGIDGLRHWRRDSSSGEQEM